MFPVKSVKGVFTWITCPFVLQKATTDLQSCEQECEVFNITSHNVVAKNSGLVFTTNHSKVVMLEEYTFNVVEDKAVNNLGNWLSKTLFKEGSYWGEKIKKDIVILSNDDFRDFVNLSTEVITRTKIDNSTGTVATGSLFTEEYLPAESILYSYVLVSDEFREGSNFKAKNVLTFFSNNLPDVIQIGGNLTLGKGLVRTGKSLLII